MTRRRVWALLGAGVLAACAAPPPPAVVAPAGPATPARPPRAPSVFVLLPDRTAGTGAIVVTNPAGAQELRQPWHAVSVGGADEAPGSPLPMSEAEVRRRFADALDAEPPEPVSAVLYFREGSSELTPDSATALATLLQLAHGRPGAEVSVVGHTDTVGDREANHRLGLRRAERVAEVLQTGGLDPGRLDVSSHGEADLLVPTRDGVAEPRNRRVEVVVR